MHSITVKLLLQLQHFVLNKELPYHKYNTDLAKLKNTSITLHTTVTSLQKNLLLTPHLIHTWVNTPVTLQAVFPMFTDVPKTLKIMEVEIWMYVMTGEAGKARVSQD